MKSPRKNERVPSLERESGGPGNGAKGIVMGGQDSPRALVLQLPGSQQGLFPGHP